MVKNRIQVLDALRGVALLGILLMNIPYFGLPYQIVENLSIRNEFSGYNYLVWWVVNGVFEGTMRALFSMLFGASILLFIRSVEKKELSLQTTPADYLYRRLIWLLVFGLINAFVLNWPGDILYSYALCGLFIYPFRNISAKKLIIASVFCVSVFMFFVEMDHNSKALIREKGLYAEQLKKSGMPLNEETKESLKDWEEYQQKMSIPHQKKESQEEKEKVQQSYPKVFSHFAQVNFYLQTHTFYFDYFWDTLSCFFLGMALFKMKIIQGERSQKFYLIFTFIAYFIGIPLSYYFMKVRLITHFDISLETQFMPINLYQLKRIFMALGHLGLILLLFNTGIFKFLFRYLQNVGKMAFSNYLMQSIICSFLFYGYGFGLFGELERFQLYYVVIAIWIFQLIFSTLWLKYFLIGPFEWVWRSLTYWKRQSFRIPSSESPIPNNNSD